MPICLNESFVSICGFGATFGEFSVGFPLDFWEIIFQMASGSGEGSGFPADDYESLIATTDVELLKRAWRNEKAAPEILQYQTALVQRSREQIQLMVRL